MFVNLTAERCDSNWTGNAGKVAVNWCSDISYLSDCVLIAVLDFTGQSGYVQSKDSDVTFGDLGGGGPYFIHL